MNTHQAIGRLLHQSLAGGAVVRERGCRLFVDGDSFVMQVGGIRPARHAIFVPESGPDRLAAHWTGFIEVNGVAELAPSLPAAPLAKPVRTQEIERTEASVVRASSERKPRRVRTYEVTVTPRVVAYSGSSVFGEYVVDVDACDHSEAIKQIRQGIRDQEGRYGVPCSFRAKLKGQ